MNKGIMWISSMALAMFISQPVLADMHPKCPCYKDMKEKMMKKLELTDEQKTKLEDVKKQYKDQLKAKHDEMKDLRQQMKDLAKADKLDEAKLDQLISQKKELVGSMTKLKVQMKHAAYGILTPEQVKKAETVKKEIMDKCMIKDDKDSDSTQMMDLDDTDTSTDE